MRRVMMAEDAAGAPLRPGEYGFGDQIIEVTPIYSREESLQIVNLATRRRNPFAPSLSARQIRGAQKRRTQGVRPIDPFYDLRRLARKQSGHQQKCERSNDFRRRRLKHI